MAELTPDVVKNTEPTLELGSISNSLLSKIPSTAVGEVKQPIQADDSLLDDPEPERQKEVVTLEPVKPKVDDKEPEKPKTPEKEDETEESIISVLKSKFGEVEGEFDEDLDGLTAYTEKVIQKERETAKLEGQEELLTSAPVLKALKEHLDAGYGVNSFLRKQELVDWDSIKFKDDDAENEKLQEEVFITARRTRGDDEDDIKEALGLAKDKGQLKDKAEKSKIYLKGIQDNQIKIQQDKEKELSDRIKKEEAENLVEVEKVLKAGNLYGVSVTADKIKELRKFSLEVDKKGVTERDRKIASLTIEQGLLLDLILMNDFKDLGAKPKVAPDNRSFQKLKEATDAKKKVSLNGGGGLTPSERQNINVKNIFQNN